MLRLSAIEISTKIGLKLEKEFEFFVPSKMKKIIVGNPSQKKLGTDAFLLSFLLSSRSLHTCRISMFPFVHISITAVREQC